MRNVIVGAGVCGLTIAERITADPAGGTATVIEREEAPGGLARTFSIEGFDFDIGPHRFHTVNPQVDHYLREILEDSYIEILRKSSVFMAGRYRNWPLTAASLLGLPVPVLWRSFIDLFRKSGGDDPHSFADFIRSRYGENLYDFFFRGYTRKFTGIPAEELHLDWAQAGVNRAVIDKRVKADSLFSLLKGMLLPKPVATSFYYPSRGGIQTFCDIQASKVRDRGGKVLTGKSVAGIMEESGKVVGVILEDGSAIEADRVFWTAPLTILYPETGLEFINTLIACVALERPNPVNDYQWCYFGQEDIVFSRLTVPRHFRDDCTPQGRDSLVAEITCSPSSPEWKDPCILDARLREDLARTGAADPGNILFVEWRRIPETYPVYTLDYRQALSSVTGIEGLHLMGRCGSFWYNNMDHSISQALACVEGTPFERDFWKNGS